MKFKFRLLVTFFLFFIGIVAVIKTVSAIETPKLPDFKLTNQSNSGRKWTVVTFAENMPCGETSKIVEVGDYQNLHLFIQFPSDHSNCDISIQASPDKNIWQTPEFIRVENGIWNYNDSNIPIIGPYYRISTTNGQGNFSFKAYLYSN